MKRRSRGRVHGPVAARTSARRDSSLAGCVDDVRCRRPVIEHDVPARTADEDIRSLPSLEDIVSGSAPQLVGASPAHDEIVAALALQDVWALAPGDAGIVPGRSLENRGPVL